MLLVAVSACTHHTDTWIPSLPFHWCFTTPAMHIIDMINSQNISIRLYFIKATKTMPHQLLTAVTQYINYYKSKK